MHLGDGHGVLVGALPPLLGVHGDAGAGPQVVVERVVVHPWEAQALVVVQLPCCRLAAADPHCCLCLLAHELRPLLYTTTPSKSSSYMFASLVGSQVWWGAFNDRTARVGQRMTTDHSIQGSVTYCSNDEASSASTGRTDGQTNGHTLLQLQPSEVKGLEQCSSCALPWAQRRAMAEERRNPATVDGDGDGIYSSSRDKG